jgi:hypothetical protein
MIIEAGRNANLVHPFFDQVSPARRVGENYRSFGSLAQLTQRVESVGRWHLAVEKHTPEVEDIPVVLRRDFAQAGKNAHAHNSGSVWRGIALPTASATLAKPSRTKSASSSRLMRVTSPGPSKINAV